MSGADDRSERQGTMLRVRCECGFDARGTADEVVDAMQHHAVESHNMRATREQILARAESA